MDLAYAVLTAKPCMVQLRAKFLSPRAVLPLARRLASLCRERGVPFCVNDRLDLALAAEADAVHVGQDDIPVQAVREVLTRLGRPLIVGVSTHDERQALEAAAAGADYIGFGPVFQTMTKANPDPVVGLERLGRVAAASPVPVVAIGGITLDRVASVAAQGVWAAALIGAVQHAPDPAAAALQVTATFGSSGSSDAAEALSRTGR